MKLQNPSMHGSKEAGGVKSVMGRGMDKLKAMCPLNYFKFGDVKI